MPIPLHLERRHIKITGFGIDLGSGFPEKAKFERCRNLDHVILGKSPTHCARLLEDRLYEEGLPVHVVDMRLKERVPITSVEVEATLSRWPAGVSLESPRYETNRMWEMARSDAMSGRTDGLLTDRTEQSFYVLRHRVAQCVQHIHTYHYVPAELLGLTEA